MPISHSPGARTRGRGTEGRKASTGSFIVRVALILMSMAVITYLWVGKHIVEHSGAPGTAGVSDKQGVHAQFDSIANDPSRLKAIMSALDQETKVLKASLANVGTPPVMTTPPLVMGLGVPRTPGSQAGDHVHVQAHVTTSTSNTIDTSTRQIPRTDVSMAMTDTKGESIVPGRRRRHTPTLLIVGGTDGSGTRRVVQLLADVGVVMVSEDPGTLDVHGQVMKGGWPPVIKPIVKAAGGDLGYDPALLPADVVTRSVNDLKKLLKKAEEDSHRPEGRRQGQGGALRRPVNVTAAGVQWGLKAPVAMALVPFFVRLRHGMKFLHVTRDGRDIALSSNQTPVKKFYEFTFSGKNSTLPASATGKAINLWRRWNLGAARYGTEHAGKGHMGYLHLRSEDLASHDVTTRFGAMQRVAEFVGSSLSNRELCCLALEEEEFMGSHDVDFAKKSRAHAHAANPSAPTSGGEQSSAITTRYGKWRTKLKEGSAVLSELNEVGKDGLAFFGYEPFRPAAGPSDGFQCHATPEAKAKCEKENSSGVAPRAVTCRYLTATDFRGKGSGDIGRTHASSREQCCKACTKNHMCEHFTFDTKGLMCFLKTGKGQVVSGVSDFTSGSLVPKK